VDVPTTLITAFEVPPDADEEFAAGWERANAGLAAEEGYEGSVLHRALRGDAAFRFVDVSRTDSPEIAVPPFTAHPGRYEVVRDAGSVDGHGGVLLIDLLEVPAAEDERLLASWDEVRDVLARQAGHLGARLYRCAGRGGFRFVGMARWSSPLMYARALKRPEVQRAGPVPFPSHPALYLVAAINPRP
jgi:heme-degrading monooxygenase HmoA